MTYEIDAQEFNLNENRVTLDLINSKIKKEQYIIVPDCCMTMCILTLENGYTVLGKSACADPSNFRRELGEKYAKEDAIERIWPLEGYLLKQRLFESGKTDDTEM